MTSLSKRGLDSLRSVLSRQAASLIRSDPERAAVAVELGLVDRAWLKDPTANEIFSAAPLDVVQRFLERSMEQKPSIIGQLGLNALSLMSYDEVNDGSAHPTTIVFTDLEGFTAYTDSEGDVSALRLLDIHHKQVGPIIRGRGGRVVKRLGDGLLLTFPSTDAALLAALDLEEVVRDPLRIRIGVHHGAAVSLADDLLGHEVNVAARVTDSAAGGEVVATAAALAQVDDLGTLGVEVEPGEQQSFKGLSGPIETARVKRA